MSKTMGAASVNARSAAENTGWDGIVQRVGSDPADLMLRQEDEAMIQRALDSLPEVHRTAVVLSDIEGMPHERISEIMLCPLGTVRLRIQEGHILMKKALKEIEKGARH